MKVIISMHMLESEEKGVCPFHCWFSLFLLLGNCISPHEVLILISIFLKMEKAKTLIATSLLLTKNTGEKNDVQRSSIGISKF